eukprot:14054260-Alexandrium_andersonii.AAC.1
MPPRGRSPGECGLRMAATQRSLATGGRALWPPGSSRLPGTPVPLAIAPEGTCPRLRARPARRRATQPGPSPC